MAYEIQDKWNVFRKVLPEESDVQAIKIITNAGNEIQGLFMVVRNNNPVFIKAVTPDQYIRTLHDGMCINYVKESVEGAHPAKTIEISGSTRLESVFTDKSLFSHKKFSKLNNSIGEYKYATILTWFIGDQPGGVAASVAILSNEISGPGYDDAIAAINSLKMK